jgi:hypothetical protein
MQERAKNLSSAGVEVPPKTPQEQVGFFERLQQLRQNHQKKDEPATPPGEIGFF